MLIISLLPFLIAQGKYFSAEEATSALDALLLLLSDQESFVYLNALVAVRALSEGAPKLVFAALLRIFAGSDEAAAGGGQGPIGSTGAIPLLPQARRAMVGEALVLMIHRAEQLKTSRPVFRLQVVELLPSLVHVCLKIAQRRASTGAQSAVQAAVDLSTMRVISRPVEEHDGDASSSATNLLKNEATDGSSGDDHVSSAAGASLALVPSAQLVQAMEAADADILRQSAVSLLAEALSLAGPAAYKYLDDVIDLALGVLGLEQGHGQSVRAARR